MEGCFVKGNKRHGRCMFWHGDGRLKLQVNYVDGVQHGDSIKYEYVTEQLPGGPRNYVVVNRGKFVDGNLIKVVSSRKIDGKVHIFQVAHYKNNKPVHIIEHYKTNCAGRLIFGPDKA